MQNEAHRNIEADIIGSVISNPGLFDHVKILLVPDFSLPDHQSIWKYIRNAIANNTPINALAIKNTLNLSDKDLPVRISSNASQNSEVLQNNAKILSDYSRKRLINKILSKHTAELSQPDNSWQNTVQELVKDILNVSGTARAIRAESALEKLKRQIAQTSQVTIPTGLAALDNALGGGLSPATHVMIGGYAKTGKTTLTATISHNMEINKILHLVVSLERKDTHIEALKASRQIGCNANYLRDHIKALNSIETSKRYCIYINDNEIDGDNLRHEILYLKRRYGIKAALIDCWQLIGGIKKGESKDAHKTRVAQMLQQTSCDADIPIVTTYQLSEANFSRDASVTIASACSNLNVILQRDQTSAEAWMEVIATNITDEVDIGGITNPQFILDRESGPHFKDITQ